MFYPSASFVLASTRSIKQQCGHSYLRVASCSSGLPPLIRFLLAGLAIVVACELVIAQQTNPVDRKVSNPMTDTPDVNPLNTDQPVRQRPTTQRSEQGISTDRISVEATTQSVSGPENARVAVYQGNVDVRIGTYRLQADKVTVYDATNKLIAEGNVVFDQGDQQRITGSRAEWNYKTKTGSFVNSTGYTNQTQDGTRVYFPSLKVKGVPVFYLPYASVSIKRRDRASGFLTPTIGGSGSKGVRLSTAYYQTLGRSADFTLRSDIYTARGLGLGGDLRTRANSRSFLNAGFYTVKDRIFGAKADATHPNQGG